MNFETWVDSLISGDTRREASAKAGKSESTLSRQLSRNALSPEMVIALCRAYDRPAVTGLVETGYLQTWEAETISPKHAASTLSHADLLAEVQSRFRTSEEDADLYFGTGGDSNVVDIRSNTVTPGVGDDDILKMPDDAVAKSGENDDREGQEFD